MSRALLLVDDDDTLRDVLADALAKRGYTVHSVADAAAASRLAQGMRFNDAIVDLCLPGHSGLKLVEDLRIAQPEIRIVVFTGYASIATAVKAIKLGAVHYLTKPVDADELVAALTGGKSMDVTPTPTEPPSVERLEWEHIQRVLGDCDGNISEAARRLRMHRRTLQRKLRKRPVRR